MSAALREIARALGGEACGRSVLAPGPGHSRQDRSLQIIVDVDAPDGFSVHSYAGDHWRACRDYVRTALGLPGFHPPRREPPRQAPQASRNEDEARQRRALAIWREARDPRGTIVETYLNGRKLDLPDEAAGEVIRFHPRCPFGIERLPAMICLVRNFATDTPQAIHRTALTPDGKKVERNGKTLRMSLGSIIGGAIKLDSDEDVTHGLCAGEGVETCLSARQMGLRPVWSAVSTSGIKKFPVLPGVAGLHLFAENDANDTSRKAIAICGRRWHDAGRDVHVVTPEIGNDLNDELLRGMAHEN
jgi:putative DNA primase/helicase